MWCQRRKLENDKPLSNVAFNFKLSHYSEVVRLERALGTTAAAAAVAGCRDGAGRTAMLRAARAGDLDGRGFHSSTSQLHLSRFGL